MSGTDELCMTYGPVAGRAELVRLIAAAGGLTLHESAELPAGESKSEYLSPSGTPLLKHGDLKLSQSGAIEAYLASIAPKFSGLTPQQRAIDSMYAGIKEEMLSNCAKALFTTKNGEDVTKLLDDRWFPLLEASIPAEGFINGLAFPTVADLVVLNIKTGYGACPFASTVVASRAHIPTAPHPPCRLAVRCPQSALSVPSVRTGTSFAVPFGAAMKLAGYDATLVKYPKVKALADRTAGALGPEAFPTKFTNANPFKDGR